MSEPQIATSLDDIADVTVTINLLRPDGREIAVQLRALSEGDIWQIRRGVKWPKPPVKNFKKVGGDVITEYDYLNDDYQEGIRAADRDLMRRILVASLMLDISGATVEEKCATLEKRLGQWAFNILNDAVNKLNVPTKEMIDNALNSFRAVSTADASDHGETAHTAA
jgi:hypothetical protein